MILYFVRHGKAGHHTTADDDDERVLTSAGVDALRAAAPLWRRLDMSPDLVISSPLPRALQTAELLIESLGLTDRPLVEERLRPGAGWGDLARALAAHPEASSVMFVGHEPDMSNAVRVLTGDDVRLRKGAVARVEFAGAPEAGAGELAWLLDPDLYTG